MMKIAIAAVFSAALIGGTPALAKEDALAVIFDDTQVKELNEGTKLNYDYVRKTPYADKIPSIEEGSILLETILGEDGRKAVVYIGDGTRSRRLEDFSGDAGNPAIVVFLESVSTTVARSTGGSIFYIKNRFKDALRDGADVEKKSVRAGEKVVGGKRIVYRPFAKEAEKARLLVFADLSLEFVFSDHVPGKIISLTAKSGGGAPDGYIESIIFAEAEGLDE